MLGKNDPIGRPCNGEVPKISLGLAGGPLNVAERPTADHLSEALLVKIRDAHWLSVSEHDGSHLHPYEA
jgi:hypothetical protein